MPRSCCILFSFLCLSFIFVAPNLAEFTTISAYTSMMTFDIGVEHLYTPNFTFLLKGTTLTLCHATDSCSSNTTWTVPSASTWTAPGKFPPGFIQNANVVWNRHSFLFMTNWKTMLAYVSGPPVLFPGDFSGILLSKETLPGLKSNGIDTVAVDGIRGLFFVTSYDLSNETNTLLVYSMGNMEWLPSAQLTIPRKANSFTTSAYDTDSRRLWLGTTTGTYETTVVAIDLLNATNPKVTSITPLGRTVLTRWTVIDPYTRAAWFVDDSSSNTIGFYPDGDWSSYTIIPNFKARAIALDSQTLAGYGGYNFNFNRGTQMTVACMEPRPAVRGRTTISPYYSLPKSIWVSVDLVGTTKVVAGLLNEEGKGEQRAWNDVGFECPNLNDPTAYLTSTGTVPWGNSLGHSAARTLMTLTRGVRLWPVGNGQEPVHDIFVDTSAGFAYVLGEYGFYKMRINDWSIVQTSLWPEDMRESAPDGASAFLFTHYFKEFGLILGFMVGFDGFVFCDINQWQFSVFSLNGMDDMAFDINRNSLFVLDMGNKAVSVVSIAAASRSGVVTRTFGLPSSVTGIEAVRNIHYNPTEKNLYFTGRDSSGSEVNQYIFVLDVATIPNSVSEEDISALPMGGGRRLVPAFHNPLTGISWFHDITTAAAFGVIDQSDKPTYGSGNYLSITKDCRKIVTDKEATNQVFWIFSAPVASLPANGKLPIVRTCLTNRDITLAPREIYDLDLKALNFTKVTKVAAFFAPTTRVLWLVISGGTDYMVKVVNITVSGSDCILPSASPSRSSSPSISATPSRSRSISPTPSRSPTPSSTPSRSSTPSTTPSRSSSPSRTASITPSSTRTPSISITPTSSRSPSPSPSLIVTLSPSPSSSITPTSSRTPSPSPSATCINYNAAPQRDAIFLSANFGTWSTELTGVGGTMRGDCVAGCSGYSSSGPTLPIWWQTASGWLRIFFVPDAASVAAGADATLMVNSWDAKWYCNDDTKSGVCTSLSPTVEIPSMYFGRIDLFVGSRDTTTKINGTLYLTSVTTNSVFSQCSSA